MTEVRMPKLSDTMEEGTVLRWLKQPGERVEAGEMLLEVETDKADMEVEATVGGILREVRLDEGASGRVGDVIAVIEGEGEEPPPARAAKRERASRPTLAEETTGDEDRAVAPASHGPGEVADSGAGGRETRQPPATERRGKARVSPLARSLAAELGVDAEQVQGTGPGGRVVRRDVERAAARGSPAAPAAGEAASVERAEVADREPAPVPTRAARQADEATPRAPLRGSPVTRPPARELPVPRAAAPTPDGTRRVPLSPMRASIARRMTESKREAPHFYLTAIADMDAAVALRESLRSSGTVARGVTYNHMVVKATADALRSFPDLNARFAGDAVELFANVHIGVATALPDGLVVPVIHDADQKTLLEIANAAQSLAEKARARSFTSTDLSGATFTISNLGMYDVESFAAVINPPQAAILAVGSVRQRPHVRGGALVAAHTVSLTLSCDHRAVDGARGAELLRDIKQRLESPARLLFPPADG